MSSVVATPVDIKSFIPQPPVGLNHPKVEEIVAKVQAVISEFENGEREIPTPPTEAERAAYVTKVRSILAELAASKPNSFDIPAPPSGPPAEFDVETIIKNAKAIVDTMKAEGKEFPSLPADVKLPTAATTEVVIPQPPADFNLEELVAKAQAIFDAAQAEGKVPAIPTLNGLPEGIKAPQVPNLKFRLEAAAPKIPEGVNIDEIVAKVAAIAENLKAEGKTAPGLPEGFKVQLPEVPQLPAGPEGEAILAKVKATLATLAQDPKFTFLTIPEKVKAVIAKFDEE